MALAPLVLQRSWIEDLHVTSRDFDDDADEPVLRLSKPVVLQNPEDPSKYHVRLRIKSTEPGRDVDVVVVGHFALLVGQDAANERMIEYNAPAILYGVARGIVGGITAFTELGRLDLPSVNLVKLIDE